VVCAATVLAVGAGHTPAHAVPLPAIASQAILEGSSQVGLHVLAPSRAGPRVHKVHASQGQSQLLLSVAFAAIVAFNLAFWRHLRRAYASPRRNVWRRG